jgi:hypothetical protein
MSLKDKILKELEIQAKFEGETSNIKMLRKILETVHSSNLWRELTTIKSLRYGKLSYECHHFYYLREEIKPVINFDLIA